MSNNLPTTRRIGDLIDDATEGRLIIRPIFQRRQVWNNADKERFIDTILKGYPFPEVFIAEGKRDGKSTRREKVLVDGQQRLSAIIAYVNNAPDYFLYKEVVRFAELEHDQKTLFLDYVVAVRDLGTATNEVVREIFHRINSTDYALKSMEILNAMFSGAYKQFCEQLSRDSFFDRHKVFPKGYQKRMMDVNFCVILVTTLLSGYYKRDERNEEYLERYNEEFAQESAIRFSLDRVFDFVDQCGFPSGSRAWKQTDLLTILVEVYSAIVIDKLKLTPLQVGNRIQSFYEQVDDLYQGRIIPDESKIPEDAKTVFNYLKAAVKATNDKYARVERARIIGELIRAVPAEKPKTEAPRPPKARRKK